MGPEAKAPGKARGYADGAPEEQKVDASRTSQSSVSNQATPGMYVWEDLPWTKVERKVFKLQRRIYRACQRADTKTVHALQNGALSRDVAMESDGAPETRRKMRPLWLYFRPGDHGQRA